MAWTRATSRRESGPEHSPSVASELLRLPLSLPRLPRRLRVRHRLSLPLVSECSPRLVLWLTSFLLCALSPATSPAPTATRTICVLKTCSAPSPARTWLPAPYPPGPPPSGSLLTGCSVHTPRRTPRGLDTSFNDKLTSVLEDAPTLLLSRSARRAGIPPLFDPDSG